MAIVGPTEEREMIVSKIHINGFGIFRDFVLDDLKEGINILEGENEAGKSTLLKFIRFTLFGYPRFLPDRMPPQNGGSHGGSITARISGEKEAIFERDGKNNIRLIYQGQEFTNSAQWNNLLGNATKDIFENVFAITLEELAGLDNLKQSGIEDKIFSVGLGMGATSLGAIEKSISQRNEKIYLSSGRGAERLIPRLLKDITPLQEKINLIKNNLPRRKELLEDINKLEEEITTLENELEKIRKEQIRTENYLRSYEHVATLSEAEKRLKPLPEYREYPPDGLKKLEILEEKKKNLKEEEKELLYGTTDEPGLNELEEKIAGITVNEALLTHIDDTDYLHNNLALYRSTRKDFAEDEGKIRQMNASIKEIMQRVDVAWDQDKILSFGGLVAARDRIRQFKEQRNELENRKNEIEITLKVNVKEKPAPAVYFAGILSGLSTLGAVAVFFFSKNITGGILLLAAAFVFFYLSIKIKHRKPAESETEKEQKKIKEKLQALFNDYKKYLEKELGLSPALSTETVEEIFRLIEQTQKEIHAKNSLVEKEEKERKPFLKDFEEKVRKLSVSTGFSGRESDIPGMAEKIIRSADEEEEKKSEKEKLSELRESKKRKLKQIRSGFQETEKRINDLLQTIEATNSEDFMQKYRLNEKVRQVLERKEKSVESIRSITGMEANEVATTLSSKEKPDLEAVLQRLKDKIRELEDEKKAKFGKRGELKKEIEQLEGESELSEHLSLLESKKTQLKNAYKEWLSGKIALELLEEVKNKMEQEQQPAVIKNSSGYFREMTAGKYANLYVSVGDGNITVVSGDHVTREIKQLSRGTKEQLLISMRLGFIDEYEEKSEPLPLVMDEVLVNFDPVRARQAAEIFHNFAKNRQILLFTCHPFVKQFFNDFPINNIKINL